METHTICRMSTGLGRLDQLLGGGLPGQSLVVVAGLPGSGKTILSFHIMAEAVRQGATTMLVTTTHAPPSKLRDQYGNLSFMSDAAVLDEMEFLALDTSIGEQALLRLLNTIVLRIQERKVGVAVVDSFRAISDLAENRSQVWRFLGALSAQLVEHDCICLLVGEYSLPRDLGLPEVAVADVVIYLEVEREAVSEVRFLRVYKTRGGPYMEGRHAFYINQNGIQFVGT